ncbi:MAG: HEPN domain-containing protein [Candidatus Promineifilaceae bacterium]
MTPEQSALLQKAQSGIDAAKLLVSEAFFDFAISLAYYAMVYVAEALLLADALNFSKHSAVIAAFGKHFVKTGRAPMYFHRYLIDAQDSHLIGDYDPMPILSKRKASQQIERAEQFLEFGKEFLGTIPQS